MHQDDERYLEQVPECFAMAAIVGALVVGQLTVTLVLLLAVEVLEVLEAEEEFEASVAFEESVSFEALAWSRRLALPRPKRAAPVSARRSLNESESSEASVICTRPSNV